MNANRQWCLTSGLLVLLGVLFAWLQSPYWLILTALVGIELLQSGVTGHYLTSWLWKIATQPTGRK
jgi:hypothetical protein